MRLAFVDLVDIDYTVLTPLQRPLGGMQSALCYLATALVRCGHEVSVINKSRSTGVFGGVDHIDPGSALKGGKLNSFDVVVAIGGSSRMLRDLGVRRPIVFWTGHDIDQKPIRMLLAGSERYAWDKFVMVSEWQAKRFEQRFKLKRSKIAVIGNAIGSAFEQSVKRAKYYFEEARPPVLVYSSTPFRGLNVLLRALPIIRSSVPRAIARIYSSMAVYGAPDEPFRDLYDACRRTEGVEYFGSVGQAELTRAYAAADIFAYPSTFKETSCITLMEAMASGCLILSTNYGALPDTAAGFGHLLARSAELSDDEFVGTYARFVIDIIRHSYESPNEYRRRLDEQTDFALTNYVWARRAREWENLFDALVKEKEREIHPLRNAPCPCGSGEKFKRCCGEDLQ